MPIRAVILDYGNVLCLWPRAEDFGALYRLSGIPPQRLHELFWRYRREYDRGTLDGDAYWRRIAHDASTALTAEQIRKLIAADVQLWRRHNPVMTRWVRALREHGFKTAILSNMPHDIARGVRKSRSWLELFDGVVLSAEVGSVKPEPEIYRQCLARLNVSPPEALFIDDRAENVKGAEALGIPSLKFESTTQLARNLEPFGLPALLAGSGAA